MKRGKTIIFSTIAILIGLVTIELITRGVFNYFGRQNEWGYPSYTYAYRPYIGFAYQPYSDGRDKLGFSLHGNDDPQRDLTKKDACEYRVFMLGGSTVLGRYLESPDDTLPTRL